MKRLLKWVLGLALGAVLVLLTIILVRAFDARRRPDLKPWHEPLSAEVRAKDLPESATLADYLKFEEAVFDQMNREVLPAAAPADRTVANRYWTDSPINPERFRTNWNRTFDLVPEGEIRGGALLVHGLTDSPYSVKAVAELLQRHGYYALCLRMPGHGTVPGALTEVDWQDWGAAVRVGARHVRERIGARAPLLLVGYSNGGALCVRYALDVLEGAPDPKADRIVLLSPMIGVSRLADFAKFVSAVGVIPYFAKSRWLEILPEYIPFKYDSFPAYAAQQTAELTARINSGARRAAASGRIRELPPILALLSLVDSTVETWATVDRLFAYLPESGSELVLFDLNRSSTVQPFLAKTYDSAIAALFANTGRTYRLSLVTNVRPEGGEVAVRSAPARSARVTKTPLGLSWPDQVFSLSHLAVPFRDDDPLFGIAPDLTVSYGPRLGLLAPRGERGVLSVSTEQFMRLNCNPFFPFLEKKVEAFLP